MFARDVGIYVSASTIGRVIKKHGSRDKKASPELIRAARGRDKHRCRPKILTSSTPEQLIQIDTNHLNLPWSEKRYHFKTIDRKDRLVWIGKCLPYIGPFCVSVEGQGDPD